ncbi:MAG: hypothetical protein QM730_27145 [Anaerolineales bacterium]
MNFIRTLFEKSQEEEGLPPSAETLAEAKKVFFEYSCNGLYMAQNDVNFSQYRISKAQQVEWRNEFIAHWRSQLSTEDLTAIQKLRDAQATEAIPDLLTMVGKGDSYAQLRIAEALWALSYLVNNDKALKKQAKATAIQLAQSILNNPIQASESHKLEMAKLGGNDPKKYITLFAENVVNDGK